MWAESKLGDHSRAQLTRARRREAIEHAGAEILWADWAAAARAELALNAGQPTIAATLAERAVRVAQSVGGIFAEGLAHRTWAEALAASEPPNFDEAERHLAASLQAFEQGEARLEAARTHLAWGKLLHARGQQATAREHLEQAAAQFEVSGLEQELQTARSLLPEVTSER